MKLGPWYTDDPYEIRQVPPDLPKGITLGWTDLPNGCGPVINREQYDEFSAWHKANGLPERTHEWVFGEGEVRIIFQVPGDDVEYRCHAMMNGRQLEWNYMGPPMAEDTFPCTQPPAFVFLLIAHFDAERARLKEKYG